MPFTYTLLNRSAMRRFLRDDGSATQLSPNAFLVLERHVGGCLTEARRIADVAGKNRITGVIMRRVVL